MKKKIMTIAATLSLLSALFIAPAIAAAPASVWVDIPFSFMAGRKQLPAGRYRITKVNDLGTLRIIGRGSKSKVATFVAILERGSEAFDETEVRFRRYGNQYFLSSIRVEGADLAYRVPASRAERKLKKDVAQVEPQGSFEEIAIAAH